MKLFPYMAAVSILCCLCSCSEKPDYNEIGVAFSNDLASGSMHAEWTYHIYKSFLFRETI